MGIAEISDHVDFLACPCGVEIDSVEGGRAVTVNIPVLNLSLAAVQRKADTEVVRDDMVIAERKRCALVFILVVRDTVVEAVSRYPGIALFESAVPAVEEGTGHRKPFLNHVLIQTADIKVRDGICRGVCGSRG